MPTANVLIIEDNQQVRDLLEVVLTDEGMRVRGAGDGATGLQLVKEDLPDLVLLDHALPGGLSGLEVCRRLREDPLTANLPIVVLTAERSDEIELKFLSAGADDYIRKSQFKSAVLVGRIRAVLRRTRPPSAEEIVTEHVVIRPGRREVVVQGRLLNLTPTEFDILHKLASHPDRALSRRELLDRGDKDVEAVDRTVDVHVLSIRRKLGDLSWLVATVWGTGYRLGTAPDA